MSARHLCGCAACVAARSAESASSWNAVDSVRAELRAQERDYMAPAWQISLGIVLGAFLAALVLS